MMAEARRKQYVEVVATHYIDGSVRRRKSSLPLALSTRLRIQGRLPEERREPPENLPDAMLLKSKGKKPSCTKQMGAGLWK